MSSIATSSPSSSPLMLMQPLLFTLNHLLCQKPWTQEMLRPSVGRVTHFDLTPMSMALQVDAVGPVTAPAPDVEPAVTVVVPLAAAIGDYAIGGQTAVPKCVHTEGEAGFTNVLSALLRSLCWDAVENLSRAFGDVIAQRMVSGAQATRTEAIRVNRSLAESVASYLTDEQPTLVRHTCLARFAADMATLHDAEVCLVKRLEWPEKLPRPATRTVRQGESA